MSEAKGERGRKSTEAKTTRVQPKTVRLKKAKMTEVILKTA